MRMRDEIKKNPISNRIRACLFLFIRKIIKMSMSNVEFQNIDFCMHLYYNEFLKWSQLLSMVVTITLILEEVHVVQLNVFMKYLFILHSLMTMID